MKKYFITGLVILLPVAVTFTLIGVIINFLTKPFIGSATLFLSQFTWFTQNSSVFKFGIQVILLCSIFFFTVLLGFLAQLVLFKSVISIYDKIIHKIPIIKTVYKALQQIMRTVFGAQSTSFKQVVMVPFPLHGTYCIGLISGQAPSACLSHHNDLITVFVPTTPNPTSGYLMMYKKEDVVVLDMKVEDAFKYIISCGVIHDDSHDLHPAKSHS